MKTIRLILLLALVAVVKAPAQVPQIINYQGRISSGGTPFSGTGQFKLALVNGGGSTSYWSNDGTSTAGGEPTAAVSLPVVNGLYLVPMGDATLPNMTAIPATVFANPDVRVRVWFNDGTSGFELLTPDQRITSVGYAMVAASATTVPDGAITAAKLAPGITVNGDVNGNAATSTQGTALISSLQTAGTINQAGNPVDWTRLKNVPVAIASEVFNDPNRVLKSGDTMTGTLNMGGNAIVSLPSTPPSSTAATSRSYVDTGDATLQNQVNFLQASKLDVSGNGSSLTNLNGAALQSGSVPITALAAAARPKYDRQESKVSGTVTVPTSSLGDVTGITLTTKSLGENGHYRVEFDSLVQHSGLGQAFLYMNGTLITTSESFITIPSASGAWGQFRCVAVLTNVPSGTVFTVRAKSGGGSVYNPMLHIHGVPMSQVVP